MATWSYTLSVPHDPRASRVARDTLRSALTVAGQDALVDVATLLASEVVGNAYRHTSGNALIRMRSAGGLLRVSVWDAEPGLPRHLDVDEGSTHGRGLMLLDACADRWGVRSLGRAKSVWFEVS